MLRLILSWSRLLSVHPDSTSLLDFSSHLVVEVRSTNVVHSAILAAARGTQLILRHYHGPVEEIPCAVHLVQENSRWRWQTR